MSRFRCLTGHGQFHQSNGFLKAQIYHSRGILVTLDVQGYIGNFESVGVFGSFWVFKGILVILEVNRVFN